MGEKSSAPAAVPFDLAISHNSSNFYYQSHAVLEYTISLTHREIIHDGPRCRGACDTYAAVVQHRIDTKCLFLLLAVTEAT